ncbi:MAG: ABC transporter permease, partial [Candidatus Eiseniibacteriota bacterium]
TGQLALRNLREAVLRTVLTALGVAIGIASLVGMVSFGVAIQDQVVGSFMRSGVFDSITVTPAMPGFGRGNRRPAVADAAQARKPRRKLDDETIAALAKLDRVKEVIPDIRLGVEATLGDITETTTARGVAMSARGEGAFRQVMHGRFFANDKENACLLSLEFAKRLDQNPKRLVGKTLTLRYVAASDLAQLNPVAMAMGGGLNIKRTERSMPIVGIVERPTGPMFGGMFSSIMIPLAVAKGMGSLDLGDVQSMLSQLSDSRSYSLLTVKVNRAQDLEDVEKKIKDMGLSAFSIADALESQKKAFILLNLFLGLIGSIALTVASLGIVNTMVMSILERTREIGVMKAIGASDRDVRRIFLVEASLIGLIGGIAGIALAWLLGRAINVGVNYYLSTQGVPATNLFLIPWWLFTGALAFALVVSLVAGAFPAARAARLDPIRALRHD